MSMPLCFFLLKLLNILIKFLEHFGSDLASQFKTTLWIFLLIDDKILFMNGGLWLKSSELWQVAQALDLLAVTVTRKTPNFCLIDLVMWLSAYRTAVTYE